MWKISELKKEGRNRLKENYSASIWTAFLVSLLCAAYVLLLCTAYGFYANINFIEIMTDSFRKLRLLPPALPYKGLLGMAVNGLSGMEQGVKTFAEANHSFMVFFGMLVAVLTLLVRFFFICVFKAGAKRFFLENRQGDWTPVARLLFFYKEKRLKNSVKVLVLP